MLSKTGRLNQGIVLTRNKLIKSNTGTLDICLTGVFTQELDMMY